MSGFVGTAVEVVSELVGAVSIGGVTFFGFEVPENLRWGGKQKLEIHKLPGGDRVFDVLGADDDPITWSGYFSGPLASLRARSIDNMRTAGKAVTLIWPGFSRNVIIESFTCDHARGGYLLPYSISCQVVPQPSSSTPSIFDQCVSDFSSATGLSIADTTAAFNAGLSAVQAASAVMPALGPLTAGAAATVAVAAGVATANATIAENLAINEVASASMVNSAVNVLGSTNPVTAASNLTGALAWTANEAGLTTMQGYTQRIATNVANSGG